MPISLTHRRTHAIDWISQHILLAVSAGKVALKSVVGAMASQVCPILTLLGASPPVTTVLAVLNHAVGRHTPLKALMMLQISHIYCGDPWMMGLCYK